MRRFALLLAGLASSTFVDAQVPKAFLITTYAGKGLVSFAGEGAQASTVQLFEPWKLATDSSRNVYFSDGYYHQVFKVTPAGVITVAAGSGRQGYAGDRGRATAADLSCPEGLAVDATGNLYIADACNNRVRKVALDGTITTVAGSGQSGYAGDGKQAVDASLNLPADVAVDRSGKLYIADYGNHRIRMVGSDGVITPVAGSATLNYPDGVAVDSAGNLYIADTYNHRVLKMGLNGAVTPFAGTGTAGYGGDLGQAAVAQLNYPAGVAVDGGNNVFIADYGNRRVRKVTTAGIISSEAGTGAYGSSGDLGPATSARILSPNGVAVDSQGNLYIAEYGGLKVRKVSSGMISTFAGIGSPRAIGDGGPATGAVFRFPSDVKADDAGNVYIADAEDNRIRKIAPNGVISTLAGTGIFGFDGDGGPASAASLNGPYSLALDAGNLWIAGAQAVRKIALSSGIISPVAGNGSYGTSGDGGPATSATLSDQLSIALDSGGNLYIADGVFHRVRRVAAGPGGSIATIAGTGTAGFSGDGGPASSAQLNQPSGVAVDKDGNVYIADMGNKRIRKVSGGRISTVAGTGESGSAGDGGPALQAQLTMPFGLAFDSAGYLYVTCPGCDHVRRMAPDSTNIITTIIGSGNTGFSGDGGPATSAELHTPLGIAVDGRWNIYVADLWNQRIRKAEPAQIFPAAVVHAASFKLGPISPGEIITLYGVDLGPTTLVPLQLTGEGMVSTNLGGTQVLIDGKPAPLIYVLNSQISAVVPYSAAGKAAVTMQVNVAGRMTNTITLPVAASAPGIFTALSSGQGQGAILNQDNSLNSPDNPAARGSVVVLYATGEGQTSPAGMDGKPAVDVFPKPVLDVSVTIGGKSAQVQYAGAAPYFVAGVMQVNVTVPPDGDQGSAVPIVLKVGNASSPDGVTLAVK